MLSYEIIRQVVRSRALQLMLIVALLLLMASATIIIFGSARSIIPPYEVNESRLVDQEIQPGEILRIGFSITRRRICKVDLDRFVKRPDGSVVYSERQVGGSTPIGTFWTVIEFKVPSDIELGTYTYETTITNTCSEGIYVTTTPPVMFKVISS